MVDLNLRLRVLPSVDEVMQRQAVQALLATCPRWAVVRAIRAGVDRARRRLMRTDEPFEGVLEGEVGDEVILREADRLAEPSLRRVINATGVVIHTNLGRSCLAEAAIEAVAAVSGGYTNLEYDLDRGLRGHRYSHVEALLCDLTGAEAALVVNNNAAAVLLCLRALAEGREAVVSRGELVEIGGSFRMPDIMAMAGVRLREVGTTNRTHLKDYEGALSEATALLLKVHPSNYAILGFTAEVEVGELVALGRARGVIVMEDLGSGNLVDLASWGLDPEPVVAHRVAAGVDLVTFSGDKLLGGPQAGVIVGRRELVERVKKYPLTRALRIDKMTLAALEATLRIYMEGGDRAVREIPTLAMLARSAGELEAGARILVEEIAGLVDSQMLALTVRAERSKAGGGALPLCDIETRVVSLRHATVPAGALQEALRRARPPVIARVAEEAVLLDLRTVDPRELVLLAQAVAQAVGEVEGG